MLSHWVERGVAEHLRCELKKSYEQDATLYKSSLYFYKPSDPKRTFDGHKEVFRRVPPNNVNNAAIKPMKRRTKERNYNTFEERTRTEQQDGGILQRKKAG